MADWPQARWVDGLDVLFDLYKKETVGWRAEGGHQLL